jgi:hypothetical protein
MLCMSSASTFAPSGPMPLSRYCSFMVLPSCKESRKKSLLPCQLFSPEYARFRLQQAISKAGILGESADERCLTLISEAEATALAAVQELDDEGKLEIRFDPPWCHGHVVELSYNNTPLA